MTVTDETPPAWLDEEPPEPSTDDLMRALGYGDFVDGEEPSSKRARARRAACAGVSGRVATCCRRRRRRRRAGARGRQALPARESTTGSAAAAERRRARSRRRRQAVVETFAEGAATEEEPDEWLHPQPAARRTGGMIISAFRKSGKTVLSLNLMRSLVTGEQFLGFCDVMPVPEDSTVVWLNLELTSANAERWMRKMKHRPGRGRRRPHGRAAHARARCTTTRSPTRRGVSGWCDACGGARAAVWVIDPVAPLMGACGLSMSDDRDVAIFQAAVDRVAAEAGVEVVSTSRTSARTWRAATRRPRGRTRWEDGADSIMVLGRAAWSSEKRWIRATVRDGEELNESTLVYDPETMRLSIDVEGNRAATKLEESIKRRGACCH